MYFPTRRVDSRGGGEIHLWHRFRRIQRETVMKRIALAALFALATALVPAAFAETPPANPTADEATDMQTLREAMKTDKRAYVASVLSLTPVEAKRFWPIYDAY